MAFEMERKFLVNPALLPAVEAGQLIVQGYLLVSPEKSVRIRVKGDCAFITVKGRDNQGCRPEFEYPIPLEDAEFMLEHLCSGARIEKTRRIIQIGKHSWEVDEFHGDNSGLFIAEVELEDMLEPLALPQWITAEVTGDERYLNSFLIDHPWSTW